MMDSNQTEVRANQKRAKALRYVVAIAMIMIILPTMYFVSVGPVFAITVHCDGMLSNRAVRKTYRPLFDIAPNLTCRYLRICGVSDIDTFFVMQASSGESR